MEAHHYSALIGDLEGKGAVQTTPPVPHLMNNQEFKVQNKPCCTHQYINNVNW